MQQEKLHVTHHTTYFTMVGGEEDSRGFAGVGGSVKTSLKIAYYGTVFC